MNTIIPTPTKTLPEKLFPVLKIAASCSALLISSGCATIVSKHSYSIPIDSNPSGASLTVTTADGKHWFHGTTPVTVQLEAGAGYFVSGKYSFSLSKSGFETQNWKMEATLSDAYIGNIFFGGILGLLIVDPATGAMWEFSEKQIVKKLPSKAKITEPVQSKPFVKKPENTLPQYSASSRTPVSTPVTEATPPTKTTSATTVSPLYVPLELEEVSPPPKTIIELTEENFDSTVKQGIVLVDFWTDAAPPHEQLLEELAVELGNTAIVAKIDLKKFRAKIQSYNIKLIPTFIVFKDGIPMTTFVGIRSKETLLEAIKTAK